MKADEKELKSLKEVKQIVGKLGRMIKAPTSDLPTFGRSSGWARPHIAVDSMGYHYIVEERGQEIRHETTDDLDQLMFWIFEQVSFDISLRESVAARQENLDDSRFFYVRQEELLHKLKPGWAEVIHQKHAKILEEFPFDDFAYVRALYCKQLRESGLSEEEIDKIAFEKYPEPAPDPRPSITSTA